MILGFFMAGCSPDRPTISPDEPGGRGRPGDSLVIEGTIAEVAESWPLQLIVATKTDRVHVALTPDTTITRLGERSRPGELVPNLRVRIAGLRSGASATAMTARTIEILN